MNDPSKPLVSILIAAYHADRLLLQTLASVAQQSYANWELILCEDGSRDRTEAIVQDFAAGMPNHRVAYVRHEENRGLASARNTAARESHGELLAIVDADDLWKPAHLEEAVTGLFQDHADVVYTAHETFFDNAAQTLGPFGKNDALWGPFPDCLYHHCFFIPSCVIMKRSLFEATGGFDTDRRGDFCCDLELWLRLAGTGAHFSYIPASTVLYRQHTTTMSAQKARMAQMKAWAMFKHRDTIRSVPWNYRRERVGTVCAEAARLSIAETRLRALYYWMAFRAYPLRPKYLAAAALHAACSLLPGGDSISRRLQPSR